MKLSYLRNGKKVNIEICIYLEPSDKKTSNKTFKQLIITLIQTTLSKHNSSSVICDNGDNILADKTHIYQ